MRKILKSFFILTLAILFISRILIAQNDIKVKPDKFPKEAIKLIEQNLINTPILDTLYLLNFNYLEYLKILPLPDEKYDESKQKELRKYSNYSYIRYILKSLSIIESDTISEEIQKNHLFKIEVQMHNRPVSVQDLEFVYNYWDLDKIEQ